MRKNFIVILLLSALCFTGSRAENEQTKQKIEPPDWYKAGVIAAIEDKNSVISSYDFELIQDSSEWLNPYLASLPEQRIRVIDSLITKRLKDSDDDHVHIEAIETLAKLQVKEAIPGIAKHLDDKYAFTFTAAVKALAQLGAKEEIPNIVKHLNDINNNVIHDTIESLAQLEAKEEIPKIIEYLNSGDNDTRASAIKALARLKGKAAIPDIVNFLANGDEYVRRTAIEELTQLKAQETVSDIAKYLTDDEPSVRSAAINALVELNAQNNIPDIIELLKNLLRHDHNFIPIWEVIIALEKLQAKEKIPEITKNSVNEIMINHLVIDGSLNPNSTYSQYCFECVNTLKKLQVKSLVPEITKLLSSPKTRQKAIELLGKLQLQEAIPQVAKYLIDTDENVRRETIVALGKLQAREKVPEIIKRLDDNIYFVRINAINVLAELDAEEAIPKINELLTDIEGNVKPAAIEALGKLQAKDKIHEIIKFLTDDNGIVQESAVKALVQLEAKEVSSTLVKLLDDDNIEVINAAIIGLVKLQAKDQVPEIVKLLSHDDELLLKRVIYVLAQLQIEENQLIPKEQFFIAIHNELAQLYKSDGDTKTRRFIAHLLAGTRFQTLVWCLGKHDEQDCNAQIFQNDHQKAIDTLTLFKDFYQAIPKQQFSSELRKDLVSKINIVAEVLVAQQSGLTTKKLWQALTASPDTTNKSQIFDNISDFKILNNMIQLLEKDKLDVKDLQRKRDEIVKKQQWLKTARASIGIIASHLAFWLMLILLYPRWRMAQAIFFWNPWVRRILGLGYVGFCLTWIPFLRHRLLSPFKESLLADANLATFHPQLYFADMSITLKNLNPAQPQPLLDTLAKLKGQIILEGESGLGKTMYLRYLAQQSKQPFAFLHANRCTEGVIPALQKKLHGFAQDEKFLTSIIYAGGLDLCIDGLNEVSPDTRAKITLFVEQYFKSNILLSTQPLEWQPPATTKTYRLLPLNRGQIEAFLSSRPEQPAHYVQTYTYYLNTMLSEQLSSVLRELHFKILSNPMDLTVVAYLLAQGIQPNLSNLMQQQYQTMCEDYRCNNQDTDFPLKRFAQHVFDIRLSDKRILNHADFNKELDCLEAHKLVVIRMEKNNGSEQEQYYFRHDKIWDFFNAYVLKQHDNEWRKTYFPDERFRGAFLALVWSLSLNEAQSLLDELQRYSVQTNDNILHHHYYQLLDLRIRLVA